VTLDSLIRFAALVAAVVVLAAPYRGNILGWLTTAAQALYARHQIIWRVLGAGLLLIVSLGHVGVQHLQLPQAIVPVEEPTAVVKDTVEPIARAMKHVSHGDRLVWAATWNKAADVARGDASGTEPVLTTTNSVRLFTVLALDIAWRRISKHVPGSNEPLRKAVQSAMDQTLGTEAVEMTPELRAKYAELCNAIAWAGIHGG